MTGVEPCAPRVPADLPANLRLHPTGSQGRNAPGTPLGVDGRAVLRFAEKQVGQVKTEASSDTHSHGPHHADCHQGDERDSGKNVLTCLSTLLARHGNDHTVTVTL